MGYEIGQIRIIEIRLERYLKERNRLNGAEDSPSQIWKTITAADDLAEALELTR